MRVATLDTLHSGSRGEIVAINDNGGDSSRLRRVGLREGIVVEVMSSHDPVMLRFDGCCVAVGRDMLSDITICRCGCRNEDFRSRLAARIQRLFSRPRGLNGTRPHNGTSAGPSLEGGRQ